MPSLFDLPNTFATGEALRLGVHPRELYRWRDHGDVIELSRGIFRRGDAPAASRPDELAVARRVPKGVLCCLSAAVVHDLTDELPRELQIAIRAGSSSPRIDYPRVQVLRFAAETFELGLTTVEAAPGEPIRIYDPVRTVVDLIRLRHRFGESVAFAALNRYLTGSTSRRRQLRDYAAQLGAERTVGFALDVIAAS